MTRAAEEAAVVHLVLVECVQLQVLFENPAPPPLPPPPIYFSISAA